MAQQLPLAERLAGVVYWGPLEEQIRAQPMSWLAERRLEALGALANGHEVGDAFRALANTGEMLAAIPYPFGQRVPVIGRSEHGVVQLIIDKCTRFRDPTSRAARRAVANAIP